jgi:tetratricopeptide (TPR) repeat protein
MRLSASALLLACIALLPPAILADDHAAPQPPAPGAAAPVGQVTPARQLWQRGQLALDRDRFEEAIGHFELSLRLDPSLVQNHLSIAAAHLALDQQDKAAPHLAAYLAARPQHFLIRWHYAEVLLGTKHPGEARSQLEQFVAAAQEHPGIAEEHLVACHTRLMEIAEGQNDDYGEHLNRGIGLYLLAQKQLALPGAPSAEMVEELLCKAAAELTLARLSRPGQARPCWYLYGVWTGLAQRQPAERWLRAARHVGPLSDLTPAEQRDLCLAAAERRLERHKK